MITENAVQLNLYLVISETLTSYPPYGQDGPLEPPEDYRIAELVVARNRAQATWLAWVANDNDPLGQNVANKPRFQTRIKAKNVGGPIRIVTGERFDIDDEEWKRLWCLDSHRLGGTK